MIPDFNRQFECREVHGSLKTKLPMLKNLGYSTLSKILRRSIVVQVILALAFSTTLLSPVAYSDSSFQKLWHDTLTMVRQDFPRVQHISTEELAKMLDAHSDISLLDTREPEEYEISHLKGAVLAEDVGDALDALENRNRDDLVVVYCSVGYRSSNIANKLARRGFSNVVNVEGSLFKWANENRPIYRGDTEAKKVHPYDDEWGRLLDRKFWP